MTKITAEIICELLHYNETSGLFVWRHRERGWFAKEGYWAHWNKRFAGKAAGRVVTIGGHRRRIITVFRKSYYAYRLAHLYMTGEWPAALIDHKDGDSLNDSWDNLRQATYAQNNRNSKHRADNTSGYRGVRYRPTQGKFTAQINVNKKAVHLGTFPTESEAVEAYETAARKYFGEFVCAVELARAAA